MSLVCLARAEGKEGWVHAKLLWGWSRKELAWRRSRWMEREHFTSVLMSEEKV